MLFSKRTLQLNDLQMDTIENKWLQLFGLRKVSRNQTRLLVETKYFSRKPGP